MAINIHTDLKFEKQLNWLCQRLQKNKTQVLKELVEEKYRNQRTSLSFGALSHLRGDLNAKKIVSQLKEIDEEYDDLG